MCWKIDLLSVYNLHIVYVKYSYLLCIFRKFQSCSFCPFSWWQCTSQRVGYFQNANDVKVGAISSTLAARNCHLTTGATSKRRNATTNVKESINARTEICFVSQRSRYKPWQERILLPECFVWWVFLYDTRIGLLRIKAV